MALVVVVACAASVFGYIHRFAANVLYNDQWTDIDLLSRLHHGTLGVGTLWAQHNENRILVPHLVVLALGATSHFDVVVEDYLNGILACGFVALVVMAHRRHRPQLPWLFYCPVALVLLSFSAVGDTLFGFNLTWYLALVGLAAALYLLDRVDLSRLSVALAVVAAVAGSYSSIQGLFIWPAGLVLLLLRHRSRRVVWTWIVSGAVTTAVYFAGFDFSLAGGSDASPFHHPLFRLEYFLSVVGNVMGLAVGRSPESVNALAVTLGVLVMMVAAVAVVHGCRSGATGGAPIGVALIAFGVLFALSVTFGRVQGGLHSAWRYDIFSLTIWVGAYLALVAPPPVPAKPSESDRPSASPGLRPTIVVRAALVVLLVLMGGQWVVSTSRGLQYGRAWRAYETDLANVTANIDTTSDGVVQQELGGYPVTTFRQLAADAQTQRLSLFDTPLVAADRRSGLPSYLVTTVLRPSDGATVSGTVPLDASVGTTVGSQGATVTFQAQQAGRFPVTVGTGRHTIVGWVTWWDTTGVADGTYLIQSVLHRPGRPTAASDPIIVHVHNQG